MVTRWWLFVAVVAGIGMADSVDTEVKIGGWGWFTFGKVGSGFSEKTNGTVADVDFTKYWLTDFNGGVKLEKKFENDLTVRLHGGFTTAFLVLDQANSNKEYGRRRFAPYLIDAAIVKSFRLDEKNALVAEFGYLPVRYNQQAANLGEYLFGRSTPYPAVIESGFELSDKEKVPGLHLGYTLQFIGKSTIKVDNYLFTEMKQWPIGDISEALLVAADIEQFVELGAGINFHHLISVDERQTTPGLDPVRMTGNFNLHAYRERVIKPGNPPDTSWDTTLYTARGIKTMARFTLNPRALIPWGGFGREDLKIYAEAAILGLENYPGWYENVKERIPVMFGFNFPAFKLLDVLSMQLQWFGSNYYNTWENQHKEGKFVPYVKGNAPDLSYDMYRSDTTLKVDDDNWKWSIYLSRKIVNRVRLSLQFANDNLFKTNHMPGPPYTQVRYTEICRRTWVPDENGNERWGRIWDWYWMGRVTFYL